MPEQWFLNKSGQQLGPYTWAQLEHFARAGAISPADLLWNDPVEGWVRANQVQGLPLNPGFSQAPQVGYYDHQVVQAPRRGKAGLITLVSISVLIIFCGVLVFNALSNQNEQSSETTPENIAQQGAGDNFGGSGDAVPAPSATESALDNYRISFMSNRDGQWEIYTMKPDGSEQFRVTNSPSAVRRSSWSPDGSKLVYAQDVGGYMQLFTVEADGDNPVQLTSTSAHNNFPNWSPDGRQIVFESNVSGAWQIHMMDADGSNPVQLTNAAGTNGQPCWAPNGTKIAFVSNRDGNFEIYTMNTDGSG